MCNFRKKKGVVLVRTFKTILKIIFVNLILMLFASTYLYSQPWIDKVKDRTNFYDIQKAFNEYWKDKTPEKGQGYKQFKRWEYFWEQRVFPSGKFPKGSDVLREYTEFVNKQNLNNNLLANESEWFEIGPTLVPTNRLPYKATGIGRLNVIRIHPKDDNILWVGSAAGGAWKSTNKGQTWVKKGLTDILSLGIGDIQISESNPDIMYIATGDDDAYFQEGVYSVGIMKSTDGGESWSIVGFESNLSDQFIAAKILIHPQNPNIVYLAANTGIHKTTDGGNSWNKISGDGFFREMEFKPGDPNTIYAVTSGLYDYDGGAAFYKTIDGGANWVKIFSDQSVNRFEIAVTPKNPENVYLLGALRYSGAYSGVSVSTNSGTSFQLMSSTPNILGITSDGSDTNYGQGYYDLTISVSPVDENLIFIGGIHIWKSADKGKTWVLINHWTGNGKPYVHADQHYLTFNPRTLELYSANDGGLYRTINNGLSWVDISNGLSITQYYRIGVAKSDDPVIIAGAQDNGSHLFKNNEWNTVNGGDGMDCAVNQENSNYVYSSSQNGNISLSTNGGMNYQRIIGPDMFSNEAGAWVTPIELNSQNQKSVYVGFKNLYKSDNYGQTWRVISNFAQTNPLDHIAVAPSDTNFIYVVQADAVICTKDGGKTWNTAATTSGAISSIAVDYDDPNRYWISVSSYNPGEKVYECYGTNKTNITNNLPNIPANCVVVHKNASGKLYLGTDAGVFVKEGVSTEWKLFSNKLPPVVVADMKINYANGKLYAGTFGRGVWWTKVFDCNIPQPQIEVVGEKSFCEGDSVIIKLLGDYNKFQWSNGDTAKEIVVYSTGSYYVNVADESGCGSRSEVVNIDVKPVPFFVITATNNGVICNKDTVSLSVPMGFDNYLWSNGETVKRIYVAEAGSFFVTAFAKNGCYVTAGPFEVIKKPIPAKPLLYQNHTVIYTDSGFKYQWYYNDKRIQKTDTNAIEISDIGNYRVEITDEFGCKNISDVYNVVTDVDNDFNLNDNFVVYPNPTTGFFNIQIKGIGNNSNIKVSDIYGKIIFENDIIKSDTFTIQVDLSKYSTGTYFIQFENNGNSYFKKIIKNY
jgi:photosystem II stability/assembly factor-like uncharacterized protein